MVSIIEKITNSYIGISNAQSRLVSELLRPDSSLKRMGSFLCFGYMCFCIMTCGGPRGRVKTHIGGVLFG